MKILQTVFLAIALAIAVNLIIGLPADDPATGFIGFGLVCLIVFSFLAGLFQGMQTRQQVRERAVSNSASD